MCIKIVRLSEEFSYDSEIPLEQQIGANSQIVVNYDPKDPSIDKFLDEVERLCKDGVSTKLNIKFNHNNFLAGAKLKKEMAQKAKDLDINEIIKLMVTVHKEADKKLEEMANYCLDGNCRVKS